MNGVALHDHRADRPGRHAVVDVEAAVVVNDIACERKKKVITGTTTYQWIAWRGVEHVGDLGLGETKAADGCLPERCFFGEAPQNPRKKVAMQHKKSPSP